MRAVVCRRLGHYRDLAVEDIPPPLLRPGGVRIAVGAAGVSFANILVIAGTHQNKPPLPFVPGTEIGGQVLEVAPGVIHLKPGDRVCAAVESGAWAAEAVANEDNTFVIPPEMELAAATHLPTLYGTAWGALAWRARLRPGETLLVAGAAGGSGLAAVEIGKALGATVIAVAGGDAKLAVALDHGADHAIDHRTEDVRERVKALTAGRGVDVLFDPVGGDFARVALGILAPEGRWLLIGFAEGSIPRLPANLLLVKNITAIGFSGATTWGGARPGRRLRGGPACATPSPR